MERRTTRLGSKQMRLSDAPSRRLLRPWDLTSERRREPKLAIQAGFRPPFTCLVQPFKAAPRIGHGRLPKAPRVHACEAWPRAPHRPVRVSPFQPALALSRFRTPHEAPLTGQDASRISEVWGTGIGIHSQFRERMI